MFERNKSITAFGEILWDVYPDRKRLGGAPFNFIYHIWKITGSANFVASIGNDDYGREIIDTLNNLCFDTSAIIIDNEHSTGSVKVILDENKNPIFTPSSNCSFDFFSIDDATRKFIFSESRLLYFGSFSARCETTRNTLLSLFNRKELKYFCDLNLRHKFYTKEFVEAALYTSNVIKINDEELDKLREMFDLSDNDEEACKALLNKYEIDLIGLTLGENGAYLFSKSESNYYKSPPAEIIDTLGAGDAYSAILCLGYLREMPVAEINQLANEFALQICKANGALPPDISYIKYSSIFSEKNTA